MNQRIFSRRRRRVRCNVLDIEASGLGSDSYPIEVGVVMASGREYQALIKPAPEWKHWCKEAEAMHGINCEALETYGLSVHDVCAELNDFCRGETLYSDCWTRDLPWILTLFGQAGVYPAFKCSPIEMVLKEHQLSDWTQHKNKIIEATGLRSHRALNDARIIAKTMNMLLGQAQIMRPASVEAEAEGASVTRGTVRQHSVDRVA
ncbi:hypothetical protein [Ketobacter sp.]